MYRVQFFCPRQSNNWQWQPGGFNSIQEAVQVCNGLIWRYHSARVIDPWGNPVYQV